MALIALQARWNTDTFGKKLPRSCPFNSNSPQFERTSSAFANGDMRKKNASDWGLGLHIPSRTNDGGVNVKTLSDSDTSCPE